MVAHPAVQLRLVRSRVQGKLLEFPPACLTRCTGVKPYRPYPQVVSDYLTPYDGELLMMRAQSNPVTVYTYRMRFWRDAQLGPKHA